MALPRHLLILALCLSCNAQEAPVPPAKPLALAANARTNTTARFTWDQPTNGWVAYYHLYYGPAPGLYTNFVTTVNTYASVSNLTRGVVYWFAASSLNDVGESAPTDPVSNAPWTNQVARVWAQTASSLAGPWSDIPGSMIFAQTNTAPGTQLFRLIIQSTNAP